MAFFNNVKKYFVKSGYDSENHLRTYINERIQNIPASSMLHENKSRIALVNASRDYYRNNSIYKGMINRIVNYIIANGMKINISIPDNPELEKEIEKEFNKYWENPDSRNIFSGIKIEQIICKELLLSGDVGICFTDKGKIQIIESERIYKKDNVSGITIDDISGEYKEFSVCPYKSDGTLDVEKAKTINSDDMLFIADLERASSMRGMPVFQSAFPILEHIDNVLKNESLAWDEITRFVAVIKQENGMPIPGAKNNDITKDRIINLERGTFINAGNNEDIRAIARDLPQNNLESALICFMRLIGLPMNIPLEAILLDWTKSNYAQARAVLEQLYQSLRIYQDLLIRMFYKPLFYKWLDIHFKKQKGKINIELDNIIVDFIPASFAWFDPLNEIKAQSEMRKLGVNTYTELCKSRGKQPDEIQQAIYQEFIKAHELSNKFETETGIKLPLNVFCGLPLDYNMITSNDNKKEIINE